MNGIAQATVLLLAGIASQAKPLPPLAPIAGLAGFESTARVVFEQAPDRPHRMVATYIFPERVRWMLVLEGAPNAARAIQYRCGSDCWLLDEGRNASVPLSDQEREEVLALFELRQALFLWPDGHDWQARTEPVEARYASTASGGTLWAVLGADGRPRSMHWSREPQRGATCSLEQVAWKPLNAGAAGSERWFPSALELFSGGARVWREEVLSVVTAVRYLDTFFFPPDRRPAPPASRGAAGQVRNLDLEPVIAKSVALPAGTSWSAARELAQAAREAAQRELGGRALDTQLRFEVSRAGDPLSCVLQLASAEGEAPNGWTHVAERSAVAVLLARPGDVDSVQLALLASSAPERARSEAAYVRLDAGPEGRAALLVLPYSAP